MKRKKEDENPAPEQYELHAGPSYSFSMKRRAFFQAMGSGIAITFGISNSLASSLTDTPPEDQLSSWIHINENGTVKIFTGKAEVGQNIRTSLAQIVAEELDVPMQKIELIMGDTALTPYDRGTFGSRSVPYMGPQLRKAAATAREVLISMAAEEWKVNKSLLYIKDGQVIHSDTKQTVNIGRLTRGKNFVKPVDESVKVTPVEQWKIAGTSVPKVNGQSFITGQHKYVSDMKLPGMLYGKVLRAPAYGAVLLDINFSEAKKLKGVVVVRDGDFIGVVAPELITAEQALKAIISTWDTKPQPSRNEIFEYLKKTAGDGDGRNNNPTGDVTNALDKAEIRIEKTFNIDYIAHAPLEPRAGLAKWEGNNLTVWTGTQRPFGVQEDLEELFKIPRANIRVIQPDTGSGYGGKHTGEAGIEAARLSKECQKPVKVVWTREEKEFTWAYFRPAGVIDIKAGATRDGIVTAWEFHNYNSGSSGIETPYDVANKKIQFHPVDSPLRQGSYRGLAATANVFARESVMNDLAEELKMDPLTFRLKNLNEPRMKGVLTAAAKNFGWTDRSATPGRGIGVACGTEKGSYVATCAEVSVDPDNGDVKVERVVVSFECGAIINPAHLENQIQGSVVQGLGGALFERIDFENGKILNPAFSRYRVPRFSDMPQLEVVMVNRKDIPPAGAGETPILGIAPAVRNAISNATGKRLYTLPLAPDGLKMKSK